MSGQLLELIIFATIAIILCNKLISLVGRTSDRSDDSQSFFGESDVVKDVTYKEVSKDNTDTLEQDRESLQNVISLENKDLILKNYKILKENLPEFHLGRFLNSSKKALKMIIKKRHSKDEFLLELIDKGYIKEFKKLSKDYNDFILENLSDISAKISEICIFGNNLFIKVIFARSTTNNLDSEFNEEWTFSKNRSNNNKIWFLAGIEKI